MNIATLTFDTLQYAKRLKDADVPDKQATVQAEALREAFSERDGQFFNVQTQVRTLSDDVKRNAEHMATKGDITLVNAEIAQVKGEIALLRKDMYSMELGLRKDTEALENRLVIRLTKSMVAVMGLGVAASTAMARLLA